MTRSFLLRINDMAIRSGNDWLMPLPQAKEAVSLLQASVFLSAVSRKLAPVCRTITEGYSDYEFAPGTNWAGFVASNNEAAFRYIIEHQFGVGYAYILTTTSAREFEALKTING